MDSLMERLVQAYQLQLTAYQEFLGLSRELGVSLNKNAGSTELELILKAQAGLIQRINEFDEQTKELLSELGQGLGLGEITLSALRDAGVSGLEPLQEILALLGQTLHELEQVEEDNQRLLEERLAKQRDEQALRPPGTQVAKAYKRKPEAPEANKIDKKR